MKKLLLTLGLLTAHAQSSVSGNFGANVAIYGDVAFKRTDAGSGRIAPPTLARHHVRSCKILCDDSIEVFCQHWFAVELYRTLTCTHFESSGI
jgi:hypothetical protein